MTHNNNDILHTHTEHTNTSFNMFLMHPLGKSVYVHFYALPPLIPLACTTTPIMERYLKNDASCITNTMHFPAYKHRKRRTHVFFSLGRRSSSLFCLHVPRVLHTFAARARSPLKLETFPLKLERWPIVLPLELGGAPLKLAVSPLKLGGRRSSSEARAKKLRRSSSERNISESSVWPTRESMRA